MSYLEQYDQAPINKQVELITRWIRTDWRPFFKEIRENRLIFVTPKFTFVTIFKDVQEVLSTFSEKMADRVLENRYVHYGLSGLTVCHFFMSSRLSREEVFTVKLYAPKINPVVGGSFMLARDNTEVN